METLLTDENGAAQSGELDPGTYTVHQTKGTNNYKIADDFNVTIKDGDKKLQNLSSITLMMVRKSESEKRWYEMESPNQNQGAEFVILDESLVKDFKDQTLATSADRLAYIEKLEKSNKDAILGTMVTDSEGNCGDAPKRFYKRQRIYRSADERCGRL